MVWPGLAVAADDARVQPARRRPARRVRSPLPALGRTDTGHSASTVPANRAKGNSSPSLTNDHGVRHTRRAIRASARNPAGLHSERSEMKGRMLASVAMTAIGVSLLAAAMFAVDRQRAAAGRCRRRRRAARSRSRTGATSTTSIRVSPYFSHSWNMMAASQLTLLYYPHTEGAGRQPPRRHGGAGCRRSRTAARRTCSRSRRASSSATASR